MLQGAKDAEAVEASNAKYQALLQTKVGNDSFVPASAQTLDNMMVLRKHKEVQTISAERVASSAQWDMSAGLQAAEVEAEALAPEQPVAMANFSMAPGAGKRTFAVRPARVATRLDV